MAADKTPSPAHDSPPAVEGAPVETTIDDDGDSSLGDDAASSTASITASILEYRTLHGRTYHSTRQGAAEYWAPNDDRQKESMDITHHVYTLALGGKLFLAPIKDDVQKVLDVGTGTGIWAIDFADKFPSAEVIGTDISPIQPLWIPPNLKFEMDDCTLEWTWPDDTFDFVHIRQLFGSIIDWPALYAEAFRVTKPGGYFENFEASVDIKSDDGSIKEEDVMYKWGKVFHEAGRRMGRSLTVVDDEGAMVGWMKGAGFVDVVETRVKVPITGWSDDPVQRDIGRFNHAAINEGLEGYAFFLLINVMGWSTDESQVFVAKLRQAMKSRKNHGYFEVACVYGRKPDGAKAAE